MLKKLKIIIFILRDAGEVLQSTSLALLFLTGCVLNSKINVKVTAKPKVAETLNVTVSNIKVLNHQIFITGTNLSAVSIFKIKDGSNNHTLAIDSKSSTSIVANTLEDVTFAAGKVFDFILSSASASSTFSVNFSLCDSSLGKTPNEHGFDCNVTPNDKEVLSYDAGTGKWKPRAVNGLSYQGVWDATSGLPTTSTPGDYYIVSVANGNYSIGDWIVYNGTSFDQIHNSSAITNIFGRTGAITAMKGDYVLGKLGDVDLATNPPSINQVLQFNGTNWVPGSVALTESDPNVSAFAKAALPNCSVGQVLKSNGSTLSCVTDATGAGAFSGTPNRAMLTDNSGALVVSAISDTVLGYLSGTTSNIQNQLDNKLNSSAFVDWSTPGLSTLDPTRLNLMVANKVVITNGQANPVTSTVTANELAYLSGATSNIQAQLNTKISSFTETDPNVSAFAKSALPTCAAGEVLKSNGTALSCVTDNSGAQAFTGTQNRVVLTDGTSGALTTSSVTNSEISFVSGVTSSIQTQLNAKQAALSSSTTQDLSKVRLYGANGSNYVELSVAALSSNRSLIFPDSNGAAGNVLITDGAGNLSWGAVSAGGGGPANTDALSEGSSNLYYTNARALGALITNPVLTNTSIAANDSIQVAMGKLQAQVSSKASSASIVDWSTSGAQVIDPTRINLTTANRAVVTNSLGGPAVSAVTSTELGYVAGVTSSIQTQLNSKLSSFTETDPSVLAFAKSALPTCSAGQVLKSNGTALSCVTDSTGAPAYSGGNNFVIVTNGSGALSDSSITSIKLGYLSGVTSDIQTQLGTKYNSAGGNLTGAVQLSAQNEVRFADADSSNYVGLKSPANVTANLIWTLPATDGSANQVLTTSGAGVLSWSTPAGGVASVNSLTGAVTLTTTNVAEGTNKYYTDTKVIAAPLTGISTATNSAVTATDTILIGVGKLQAQVSAREPSITSGTTAQYLRGDKTLSTFATDAINSALTGFAVGTNTSITAADTIVGAFGKTQSQINANTTSISAKADMTNIAQTITALSVTGLQAPVAGSDATNKTYVDAQVATKQATLSKTSTQDLSKVRIYGANATNYVELSAATLTGNRSLIFPDSNGSSGNVLTTDGAGNLSWTTPAGAVSSVNSLTGAVTLTTTNVAEGTNKYYTDTKVIAAPLTGISAATNSAVTATDTILIGVGKLQAQFNNILSLAMTGLSTATNSAIVATDSLLVGLGKLQAQITSLSTTKLDKTGGTLSIGTIDGVPNPTTANQVANKAYVDTMLPLAGGNLTSNLQLNTQSQLRFADADSSNYVAFRSPATVAANITWTLPAADGTNGQVLSTNGTGTLAWSTASSGLPGAAGTAAAPGYAFTGNTNTGLFGAATNEIGLSTNGAEKVRVDANGNMGIGVTAMTDKLQVNGTIRGPASVNNASSTTINWSSGNTQYTAAGCTGVQYTFSNMRDGGVYTLVITGTLSAACTFGQTSPDTLSGTAGSGNFYFLPANTIPSGSNAIFSFMRVGSNVYVNWSSGYAN